jgi:hypothetical protein
MCLSCEDQATNLALSARLHLDAEQASGALEQHQVPVQMCTRFDKHRSRLRIVARTPMSEPHLAAGIAAVRVESHRPDLGRACRRQDTDLQASTHQTLYTTELRRVCKAQHVS